MSESGLNIIALLLLTVFGLFGSIIGYIFDHWIQVLVFIFFFSLIIRQNKKINSLEIFEAKLNESFKNEVILKNANHENMKERYAKEFVGKVSQSFDGNNELIGYEYIIELSPSHTVIIYVSDGGKIKQFKHTFDNAPYDCKTDDEFMAYMTAIKAKAYNYNTEDLIRSSKKPIDLRSSIEEAKLYKEHGI